MKALRVNVTARDLHEGKPAEPAQCPVALAIRRHRGFEDATVVGTVHHGTRRYILPDEVGYIIDRIDNGKKVRPFRFTLPLSLRVAL